jgi:hypothetical protein
MSKVLSRLIVVLLFAGGWAACKDDPASPPPSNKVIGDTVKHTLTIEFDSSRVKYNTRVVFTIKVAPLPLPPPYKIHWRVDTSNFEGLYRDTVSYTFTTFGTHPVTAKYVDSTGASRDSVSVSIVIPDPADTSSHDFVWQEFTNVNSEANMTGCWVFGFNDVFAINGSLYHYDGVAWSPVMLYDSAGKTLSGSWSGYHIFAFSKNDFWLIGGGSKAVHFLNYRIAKVFSTYEFNRGYNHDVWGTSSQNMYVVGDSGLIMHSDGKNWSKMASGTKENISSISGTSNQNIWASGFNSSTGTSILLHYDGTAWGIDLLSNHPVSETGGFLSVWTADSMGHTVAATSGSLVYRKTDSDSWRNGDSGKVPNFAGGGYIGISIKGNSSNDLFAIGPWGIIIHWNGRSWHRYDQYFEPSNSSFFTGGASVKGNTICIVGMKNGKSWVLIGQRK